MPLLQLVDILCLPLIWPPLFCDSWLTLPLVSVLLIVPGSVTAHGDSHATCRSGHHSHCRLHRKGVKIWHFVFGNGTHLVPTYRAYPFPVWLCRYAFQLAGFFQLPRYRPGLDDIIESMDQRCVGRE